jgi:hypothetical protein
VNRLAGDRTESAAVAQQAAAIAAAWSPPGSPASWRLTAAQFETLRDEPELLALAATIAADRLPALLFCAAATALVLRLRPSPLSESFPRAGEPQPPLSRSFREQYRTFCLEHGDELLKLCATHRYQMNEVGRCADLLPALAPLIAEGRELVLVDIGTGAGLGLHLDRYRYVFRGPETGRVTRVGDEDSIVELETEVRGSRLPPIPPVPPTIVERIGIDVEPLDLFDRGVRSWLAACLPQETGAVTRFERAVEIAIANPVRTVRGDAADVLPDILEAIPAGPLICLVDTYVHVFFTGKELARFRGLVEQVGASRDLDWITIDPLVPVGGAADRSVLGIPLPSALIERNRREGLFGLIGRLQYRRGERSESLLGIAHPGAAWLEWIDGSDGATEPSKRGFGGEPGR